MTPWVTNFLIGWENASEPPGGGGPVAPLALAAGMSRSSCAARCRPRVGAGKDVDREHK